MISKFSILYCSCVGILLVMTILYFIAFNNTSVSLNYSQYPADFSNDAVLVGASHNAFVGTVIAEAGTKERGIGPETQFKVLVIENIKGDLTGEITVNQQGGYKNGKLILMAGDIFTEGKNEESLLQIGSTYLFSTRYNSNEDWHTIISYPTANKLISSKEKDEQKLKALALKDTRVKSLMKAYPEEVLLEADVKSGKTRNSYKKAEVTEDPVVESIELNSENMSTTTPATNFQNPEFVFASSTMSATSSDITE